MQAIDRESAASFEALSRWQKLDRPEAQLELLDRTARDTAATYRNSIESYIGTVRIPVGIAGPLRINGRDSSREYMVPLATSEATLVASYSRGVKLLTAVGGCDVRVVGEGVSRTPMFAFRNLREAQQFNDFVGAQLPYLPAVVAGVTRHGRLMAVTPIIEGNHVYVDLRYTTGDAAGQNMVTFASEAICEYFIDRTPVAPQHWFLEANLSGDKKATVRTLAGTRGKRVVAEATIPALLVERTLHTTPQRIVYYWSAGVIGGVMIGTTGLQGHVANGLAALFLACGQDVACVAESATGMTRLELTGRGDVYASVTLPNVMVGTVGGGTALPGARACLSILDLAGPGNSNALAEVCGGLVLGGELSIVGALCSGEFAAAHRVLSRGDNP